MIAQGYPLYVCFVHPSVMGENNSKDIDNIASMLASFTHRVVAWSQDKDSEGAPFGNPLVVVDGGYDVCARDLPSRIDFDGQTFFGDSELSAISKAIKSVFPELSRGDYWMMAVSEAVAGR